ncbi:TetR/AcrR family transcriptional regulator [Streptomyces sp. H27-D2]|uniref:TetR/AcrR family transcriptional regulator n=1 Tax=Streptomyces sp. H27-D2 TaxID=3046304 RepID=UPI002DB69752|nr:TetR/AcrR family transcriptional regulator [Streptomyces sp. H27-D2]MEC4015248.1 TetR/AcrR family transcriptional regulator [Streptomyces sp. H27-D2]
MPPDTPTREAPHTPARRSRLTPEREGELYAAVLEMLREVGYDGLTMDALASRTRSSKATLYRQWKGKPELVVSALRHTKPISLSDIDTGSLRGDLLEMVRCTKDDDVERDSALMRGLGRAVHDNPDLHQALRELMIDPEITGLNAMLQRAVDRGELDANAPATAFVPSMLVGVYVARPLVEDRHVDAEYLTRYFDAVVFPALGI